MQTISLLPSSSIHTTDALLTELTFNAPEKCLILAFSECFVEEAGGVPGFEAETARLVITDWNNFVVKSYTGEAWIVSSPDDCFIPLENVCESFFTENEVILKGFSKTSWIEYHITGAKASLQFREKNPGDISSIL